VAGVAAAVVNLAGDRFYYLVIAVLAAIVLPFSVLTLRRIQRHVALLAEGPA
jgi:Flp pilus assembly protein TadB